MLKWRDIDLEEKLITISSKISKTRERRHVDISDNLLAWLLPCFTRNLVIYPDQWRKHFDEVKKLAKIKCPTLIVHGDRDPYFNVNLALEMYNSIPNSFLWVFPNEYHLPNWSNLWSEQFLKVSKLFLTGEL